MVLGNTDEQRLRKVRDVPFAAESTSGWLHSTRQPFAVEMDGKSDDGTLGFLAVDQASEQLRIGFFNPMLSSLSHV
jgi:hypothetical protein